ncbi:DNA-3-methyladenine glycosylase [Blastococcus sp. Marseille-P5729]|uniref:DNA-3-methyladenine glycosylase family protein n=1 Tax=Blastococcus sp. Marseille-P5729 TaxID=2086582 RepID=UPI000D0E7B4C|nr:AlkA N-terminal domain-containing protein [Blastococcus sp. Marseille-P5729]
MTARAHRFRHSIELPSPYDTDRLMGFLASRAIPGVEAVARDGGWRYARSLRLPGGAGSLLIRTEGRRALVTGLLSERADRTAAVQAATAVLNLRPAPAEVDAAFARHPDTRPLVARRPGLRVPGAADAAELAVRAIVGQQISIARASAACGALAAEHGEPLPRELAVDPGLTHLFPSARTLRAANPTRLRMPRARGAAIVGVADALAEGRIDLGADPVAVRRQLVALRGIGPWTAGYISMRVGQDADVLLEGDLIVRRSAAELGMPDTPRELSAYAEQFAPYRSYLTVHLWAAYTSGYSPGM